MRNRAKVLDVRIDVLEARDMAVDQAALRHIGELMRQHFDRIASEALPLRLHELVERLKVADETTKSRAENQEDQPQDSFVPVPCSRAAPA